MKYTSNISPEEFERIEQFLTKDMQEDEAVAFELELKNNTQLREKMEDVKLLFLGIREASLEQKLEKFHEGISTPVTLKKNPGVIQLQRKLWLAASVLGIVAISLWWLLQHANRNEKIYGSYFTPDPGLATVMSSSANYNFDKAMVEYKNGEYDKALATWKALLEEKPGNDTLLYFIGAAFQAKTDNDNAIANLQRLTRNSGSVFYQDACWYLGLAYLKRGKTDKAIEYIQKSDHPKREAILKIIDIK